MKALTITAAGSVDDFKLTEVYAAYSKFLFKKSKNKTERDYSVRDHEPNFIPI